MNGTERIAAERLRQIEKEGWSQSHDIDKHRGAELVAAAMCYAAVSSALVNYQKIPNQLGMWPWESEAWKPSDDPIRNLEKAGALIAAEIDRLLANKWLNPKKSLP